MTPRRRKRGNGQGSVFQQRGDGRWVGAVSLPGGKRKRVYGKTAAEADRKLVALRARLQAGLPPPDERITVGDWTRRWAGDPAAEAGTAEANGMIGRLAYKTQVSYRQVARDYIEPDWALGKVRLVKLNPDRVQRWLDDMAERDVPAPTVKYALDILRIVMKSAMRADLIQRENPAGLVTAPRWRKRQAKPFTGQGALDFLGAIRQDRLYALFVLALTTGLRRGEQLGVRWADIDEAERCLWVHQQVQRQTGRGLVLKPAKTERSEAPVALTALALRALEAHKARMREERLQLGEEWKGFADPGAAAALVFVSELGTTLDGDNVWRHFKQLLVETGAGDRRLHDTRHSTGAILRALGVLPHVIQDVLRHSKLTMALHYSRGDLAEQRAAADKLDELLGGLLA